MIIVIMNSNCFMEYDTYFIEYETFDNNTQHQEQIDVIKRDI